MELSNREMIRVYYALVKDNEWRKKDEYAPLMYNEISLNNTIMQRIRDALPHLEMIWPV